MILTESPIQSPSMVFFTKATTYRRTETNVFVNVTLNQEEILQILSKDYDAALTSVLSLGQSSSLFSTPSKRIKIGNYFPFYSL